MTGLHIENLTAGYGETVVIQALSLKVQKGECLSIIGRNGVGKTTLLSTIMGQTRTRAGSIIMGSTRIDEMQPYQRALAGIGYVPQEREIFPSLTVQENLAIGARPGEWTQERVFELFTNLAERRKNYGNQLSGGEQQMLAIARALLTNPSLLLLDEPTEGLAPVIVDSLAQIIRQLRVTSDLTIILVEQNSRVAFDFADRTVVMDRGSVSFDGSSEYLKSNPNDLDRLIGVAQGTQ